MANLNNWYLSKTGNSSSMYISNMCTNDLQKESVPNLKTVGGIIRTKEVPLSQLLDSLTFSKNNWPDFFLRKTRINMQNLKNKTSIKTILFVCKNTSTVW